MKITFLALGWEQLGVSLLSAIAKREGHDVGLAFSAKLFDDRFNMSVPAISRHFDDTGDAIQAIRDQQPDVLACSCLTGTYQWMLGVAKVAKEIFPNVKTVFGGVHASAVPDVVLSEPQVDYVVSGEGDLTFLEILRAIERGGQTEPIDNTRFSLPDGSVVKGPQVGFVQDLDSLPQYDKSLWEEHMRVGDLYMTMVGRGCPYRCTFCFNNFFAELPEGKSGKYVRFRSIDHVMEELHTAKQRYDLKYVDFEDDIFTVDRRWLKPFLERYKREINVPFQCLTHPNYIDDERVSWLKEAGCDWIQMGIQSMDEDFKFQLKRREKTANVEKALEAFNKYNMRVRVDHMFGLPGEPIEAQELARELYVKYAPARVQTYWTTFLPGTELIDQGLELGLISPEEVDRLNRGEGFDFFRNYRKIEDPHLVRAYAAYDVMFKLFPVLPRFLRRRLKMEWIRVLPTPISSTIALVVDGVTGLVRSNPWHRSYFRHYLAHTLRLVFRRFGFSTGPLTRPRQSALSERNPQPTSVESVGR